MPCPYCSMPMTSKRRVQCGAAQCVRKYNAERTLRASRETKAKTGFWPSRAQVQTERICAICAKPWMASAQSATKCCSRECTNVMRYGGMDQRTERAQQARKRDRERRYRYEWDRRRRQGCDLRQPRRVLNLRDRAKRASVRAAAGSQGSAAWTAGSCRVCGVAYISQWWMDATCSPDCAEIHRHAVRAEGHHRRRARKRAAFVAPVYRLTIYKRDRWRCQMCMKKVKRNVVVPHPLAPTLDHIVALANGGTHEPSNVRLAHFICNSRRGATDDEVQLLLFG